MRLEKVKDGKEVSGSDFLDYIDCGEFYLCVGWWNNDNATVVLRDGIDLARLQKEYGGEISYAKICRTTFKGYCDRIMEDSHWYKDLDKVMNLSEKCFHYYYSKCQF
jgi:hypothetical protein